MTVGHPTAGIIQGEKPPVLHRFGTIAGRSFCGKPIVVLPDDKRAKLVVCRRCVAIDKTRREGMPEWF
jgi:hypothetical protein